MERMNDYRSWSFTDRSFAFAFLVSLLWHLFWFFSVTIVVASPKKTPGAQPKIVSLGPVLNDAIFKTLVESRPEISRAFYRPPADFSSATQAPVEVIERYAPGDVVSVPLGKKFMNTVKDLLGGQKVSPDAGIPILGQNPVEDYFEFLGSSTVPQILSRPLAPDNVSYASRPVEIEFSVDSHGQVSEAEVVSSSGDPSVDLAWGNHLRQWIFASTAPRLRVKFQTPVPRTH